MRLRWSRAALRDLESTFVYLERKAPEATALVFGRIGDAIDMLQDHPLAGRVGRVYGTREWVVQDTSYLIGYRVAGDALWIVRDRPRTTRSRC